MKATAVRWQKGGGGSGKGGKIDSYRLRDDLEKVCGFINAIKSAVML